MTVYMYSGTPGAGKSLHLAKTVLHALDGYRPVIANFEINRTIVADDALFFYLGNDEMTPDKLEEFSEWYWGRPGAPEFKEDWITLVIDEAQLVLNCRAWNAETRKAYIRFFTLHRKLGYRVLLSSQFAEMIDKQIRDSCIEYDVRHRKMNNAGIFGFLVHLVCGGRPCIKASTYWYKKDRLPLDNEFFCGNRRLYSFYDTRKVFDAEDVVRDAPSHWWVGQLPEQYQAAFQDIVQNDE